jgi:LPS sulfotransferase NodH
MMQYFDDVYEFLADTVMVNIENRFDIFDAVFGRLDYIFLSRKDKIKQAVSLHKAHQNFVWKVTLDEAFPDESPLRYDFGEIDRIHGNLIEQESTWESYFEHRDATVHRLFYEDLIDNYSETIQGVLDFLDIDYSFKSKLTESRLRQQANDISVEWAQKYISEKGI